MKFFRSLALALCLLSLNRLPSGLAELPQTETREIDHDPFDIWQKKPRDFETAIKRGAKVVYMPEEDTFFTYWVPPHYQSGRIVVSVHGTGGNPYIAIRDEFKTAEEYDYIAVAVSWFSPGRGFYKAQDLYRNILEALSFIQTKYKNDLSSVAYIGFSRGSAVSYEVAYLDAHGENLIDLFISHSGGMPRDYKVEAKKSNAGTDSFFEQLGEDKLGPDVFKGKKFFLYSGDKDEAWGGGNGMSKQMEYAKQLIETHEGQVLEWVRDPNGGHMGLLKNPEIKAKALHYFLDLTSKK